MRISSGSRQEGAGVPFAAKGDACVHLCFGGAGCSRVGTIRLISSDSSILPIPSIRRWRIPPRAHRPSRPSSCESHPEAGKRAPACRSLRREMLASTFASAVLGALGSAPSDSSHPIHPSFRSHPSAAGVYRRAPIGRLGHLRPAQPSAIRHPPRSAAGVLIAAAIHLQPSAVIRRHPSAAHPAAAIRPSSTQQPASRRQPAAASAASRRRPAAASAASRSQPQPAAAIHRHPAAVHPAAAIQPPSIQPRPAQPAAASRRRPQPAAAILLPSASRSQPAVASAASRSQPQPTGRRPRPSAATPLPSARTYSRPSTPPAAVRPQPSACSQPSAASLSQPAAAAPSEE